MDMNKKGWLRLVILLSAAWIIIISGIALYEYSVAPSPETLSFRPQSEPVEAYIFLHVIGWKLSPSISGIALVLNKQKLIKYLFLPLVILWSSFLFIYFGGSWVKAGFNNGSKIIKERNDRFTHEKSQTNDIIENNSLTKVIFLKFMAISALILIWSLVLGLLNASDLRL